MKCTTCEKVFKSIQSRKYHEEKAVCRKYECIKCGKLMASKLSLKYHIDHKVCISEDKKKPEVKKKFTFSRNTVSFNDIDIHKYIKKIIGFSTIVFKNKESVIPQFIKLLLCNKDFSENWGIYMQNQSNDFIRVYSSDGWTTVTKKQLYDDLFKWALNSLEEYLAHYIGSVKEKNKGMLSDLSTVIETDKKFRKQVINEVFCLFVNLKPFIVQKLKVNRKRS